MGKSSPKPPAAPDPGKTAAAQGAANVDTAIAQAFLNMTGSNSPYGSISYTPTGNTMTVGSGKDQRTIPQYTQNTTLSPEQQRQFDLQSQISESALGLGQRQIGSIDSALSSPFKIQGQTPLPSDYSQDRQNIEDKLYQGYTRRFDDQFGRQEEQLRTRLANQGLNQGSEAYSNAFKDFDYGRNDAYQGAASAATQQAGAEQSRLFGLDLTGRQQGIQEQVLERSQPVNELAALLGTSGGVQMPNFTANAPQTGIAGTDITGPTMANYQAQLGAYNQGQANKSALMGDLFGLGGTLGAAWILSDRRAKENIEKVGKLNNGLPVYLYNYKGDDTPQIGVMAQDVEKENPEAVAHIGGTKVVNYQEAVQ